MFNPWNLAYEPLRELQSLLRRVDQTFGALNSPLGGTENAVAPGPGPTPIVRDEGEELVVLSILPGLGAEEIGLDVTRSALTISADAPTESLEGYKTHRRERQRSAFSTTIELPVEVDVERVSAQLKHGLLTIRLAKHASAKPRKIDILAA